MTRDEFDRRKREAIKRCAAEAERDVQVQSEAAAAAVTARLLQRWREIVEIKATRYRDDA